MDSSKGSQTAQRFLSHAALSLKLVHNLQVGGTGDVKGTSALDSGNSGR